MTKIEEVARANYGAHPYQTRMGSSLADPLDDVPWERLRADEQARWIKRTRAAIEAMREPTEAMSDAGITHIEGDTAVHAGHDLKAAWHAMIDAALNDTESKHPTSRS